MPQLYRSFWRETNSGAALNGAVVPRRVIVRFSCACKLFETVIKPGGYARHVFCTWQVHSYERFTPLSIETEGLERGYLDVQPGDCVVAFSRRDIYDIKQLIEAGTGQRCTNRYLSNCSCLAKLGACETTHSLCVYRAACMLFVALDVALGTPRVPPQM